MTTSTIDLEPISPDWTIAELVDWLADDSRQHDVALRRPLSLIESAVTGSTWAHEPSTVALIRSLASVVRRHGALRIGDLPGFRPRSARPLAPQGGADPGRSGQAAGSGERMPEPQVA